MEPVSIAIAAATLIATKAAEGAGNALGEAVRSGLSAIYDAVRRRFADDPAVGESIDRLEERPDSKARAAELAENLEARLRQDPAFAAELERLINDLPDDEQSANPSFVTIIKDNANVGKLTNIGVVRGNVQFVP